MFYPNCLNYEVGSEAAIMLNSYDIELHTTLWFLIRSIPIQTAPMVPRQSFLLSDRNFTRDSELIIVDSVIPISLFIGVLACCIVQE